MQLKSRKKNKHLTIDKCQALRSMIRNRHLQKEKVNVAWCGLEIPLCIPFCFGCHKVTRVLKRGKQLKSEKVE